MSAKPRILPLMHHSKTRRSTSEMGLGRVETRAR
jgi:hypothetical protein